MSDTLKKEIISFLYSNSIEFNASLSHKGVELDIYYSPKESLEELHEILEKWICYGDLFNFLFQSGSYYSFEGVLGAVERGEGEDFEIIDIELSIEVKGPNYEENGIVKIDFTNSTILSELGFSPEKYNIKEFNAGNLYVDFFLQDWNMSRLELFYSIPNPDLEDLTIELNEDQINTLTKFIADFTKNNIPTLDIDFPEHNRGYTTSAEGIHNSIYYERIEYFEFLWNDIYPDTN